MPKPSQHSLNWFEANHCYELYSNNQVAQSFRLEPTMFSQSGYKGRLRLVLGGNVDGSRLLKKGERVGQGTGTRIALITGILASVISDPPKS